MDIFLNLLNYFGIDRISDQSTFPELVQFCFMCCLALFLIIMIFKFFFSAVWQIQNQLRW